MKRRRVLHLLWLLPLIVIIALFSIKVGRYLFTEIRLQIGHMHFLTDGLADRDKDGLAEGGYAIFEPDLLWVDQLYLSVDADEGTQITITAGSLHEQLYAAGGAQDLVFDVHGFVPQLVVEWDHAPGFSITNICQNLSARYPTILFLILCGTGLLSGAYFIMKEKWFSAALWTVFLFSAGMVLAKPTFVPYGWDEYIHRGIICTLVSSENVSQFLSRLTPWVTGYWPAMLGMRAGYAFGWPTAVVYRFSNIVSAFVSATIAAFAVRDAGKYRLQFLLIALFPTCIFLNSCFTYDGIVNAVSLYFVARLCRAMQAPYQGKHMSKRDMVLLILPFALATLSKPVYALLIPLVLLIPAKAFCSDTEKKAFRGFATLATILCLAALLLPGTYDNVKSGDARFSGTDSSLQLRFLLSEPLKGIYILAKFVVKHLSLMLLHVPNYQMGSYGSFVVFGYILTALLLSSLVFSCKQDGLTPSLKQRICFLAASLLPLLVLTLTQYLVSSQVGSHILSGMQARYWLPVISLIVIAVSPHWKLRKLPAIANDRTAGIMLLFIWGGILMIDTVFCVIPVW